MSSGIDPEDSAQRNEFLSRDKQAAFYDGKVHSARFFIRNVLPGVDGQATALKSGDLSSMTIHEAGF